MIVFLAYAPLSFLYQMFTSPGRRVTDRNKRFEKFRNWNKEILNISR